MRDDNENNPVDPIVATEEPVAEEVRSEANPLPPAPVAGQPVEVPTPPPPELEAPPQIDASEFPPEEPTEEVQPQPVAEEPTPSKKRWYVIKVQSGREDSIKNAIERRVKIEGLEEFFGQIVIPTENITEVKNGKRVTKKRKKFPGYLMAEVEFNDRILYLFRETAGVGDFVGGSLTRAPTPMSDREVQLMLLGMGEPVEGGPEAEPQKIKLDYNVGDRVKIREGAFASMDGEVKEIVHPRDPKDPIKVKVVVSIWGRPVEVEVEYWQVDRA